MDEGKILIVNLSKGLIGEDNASILGSFLVTKIQLAAMSRSDIAKIEDRRPFYLYVDEFQNFATDSFATILSEARKYGLNLTVANQYISQMSETVRDAVFGNVGTMICFRVSADDAPILAKQFEPQFEPTDLLQMHNRNFIINMVIKGEKSPAFSASTLNLPPPQTDNSSLIIENTRRYYSRDRADIEKEIAEAIQPPQNLMPKKPAPQSKTTAKQWPIDQGAKAVNKPRIIRSDTPIVERPVAPATTPVQQVPNNTPPVQQTVKQQQPQSTEPKTTESQDPPTAPAEAPAKKKRTRSRKRKNPQAAPNGTVLPTPVQQQGQTNTPPAPRVEQPKPQLAADETELRLR